MRVDKFKQKVTDECHCLNEIRFAIVCSEISSNKTSIARSCGHARGGAEVRVMQHPASQRCMCAVRSRGHTSHAAGRHHFWGHLFVFPCTFVRLNRTQMGGIDSLVPPSGWTCMGRQTGLAERGGLLRGAGVCAVGVTGVCACGVWCGGAAMVRAVSLCRAHASSRSATLVWSCCQSGSRSRVSRWPSPSLPVPPLLLQYAKPRLPRPEREPA